MFNARPSYSAPSLRTLGLIALTLALAATACKNEIIGGNGGEAGDGGTGGVINPPPPTLVVGGVAEYNGYYGGAGGTGGYYGGAGGYWGGGGGDPGYGGYYGGQGGYYPGDTGGYAGGWGPGGYAGGWGTGGAGNGGWGTGGYYGGGGCGGGYGEGGGCGYPEPYDPSMLFLKIGNYAPTCGDSNPPSCVSPASWQVTIGLPYYMQYPGVYPLSHPAILSTASESGSDPDSPGSCWGGGGSFTAGTVAVLSNNGATIVVQLNGTGEFEFNADGQYVLPICQTYYY